VFVVGEEREGWGRRGIGKEEVNISAG